MQPLKGLPSQIAQMVREILSEIGLVLPARRKRRIKRPALEAGLKVQKGKKWSSKTLDAQTLSDFFDQLATLLTAGVPLLQALEFVRGAVHKEQLKSALERITETIRSGSSFSEALHREASIFNRVVIGMIQSAETSGRLDEVCRELGRIFAQQSELRGRILQAFAYPALVALVGLVTVCVLLVVVVPKITTVFEMWDTPLPLATRLLIQTSNFMSHGGILVLVGLIAAPLFWLGTRQPDRRKEILHTILMRIPFLSRLLFLGDIIRLFRTLGMLLRSGVTFVEAVRTSKEVVWSLEMKHSMDEIHERTLKGEELADIIRSIKWFPEMAANFFVIGQASGTLDDTFEKLTKFYEREFDQKIRILGTYLEPMLILGIGVGVGCLVASLLLPIFDMSLIVG